MADTTNAGDGGPDGTADGTRAEQCALRSPQYLDSIQVEDLGARAARRSGAGQGADGNRCLIDVELRGRRVAAAEDATNRHVAIVLLIGERRRDDQTGRDAREIREILDVQIVHRPLGHRHDADRNLVEALFAPLGGDDDLLEAGSHGRRINCGDGGRPEKSPRAHECAAPRAPPERLG